MATKETKVQVRRVHIGNAEVDSGMLMVVDPCYVLPDKFSEKIEKENGLVKASDSWDKDYEKAMEFCHQPGESDAEPLTNEQHRQIAYGAVCSTALGDGTYPVYAVYVGNTLVSMEVRFDQE